MAFLVPRIKSKILIMAYEVHCLLSCLLSSSPCPFYFCQDGIFLFFKACESCFYLRVFYLPFSLNRMLTWLALQFIQVFVQMLSPQSPSLITLTKSVSSTSSPCCFSSTQGTDNNRLFILSVSHRRVQGPGEEACCSLPFFSQALSTEQSKHSIQICEIVNEHSGFNY